MTLSGGLLSFLKTNTDLWATFGKMNSHLYRKDLEKRFDSVGLNGEERLMVYFLFSVVKNQKRVLKALDEGSEELKSLSWYSQVRRFVDSQLSQFVSNAGKKFPAVNIPGTNPGIDLLCWLISSPYPEHTIINISRRTTFSQLDLDLETQAIAKEGYAYYWENIVSGSSNPDAISKGLPGPKMREEYYSNQANDKYQLITLDLTPYVPSPGGYTVRMVREWMLVTDLRMGKITFTDAIKIWGLDGAIRTFENLNMDLPENVEELREEQEKKRKAEEKGKGPAST
jgi:hypothetical protein